MPKTHIEPCTVEEMDALIRAASDDDFYHLLFMVAKTTGRRLGELVGTPNRLYEEVNKVRDKETGKIKVVMKQYYDSGFRGGVQIKDIDFRNRTMRTQILKKGKYDYRDAILREDVANEIYRFVKKNGLTEEDYLFRGNHAKSYRRIQSSISRYAQKARINHKVSFHNFRHYLVTELLRKGWSYDKIAKVTGHSSPQTLLNYDHVVAGDIKEDIDKAIAMI